MRTKLSFATVGLTAAALVLTSVVPAFAETTSTTTSRPPAGREHGMMAPQSVTYTNATVTTVSTNNEFITITTTDGKTVQVDLGKNYLNNTSATMPKIGDVISVTGDQFTPKESTGVTRLRPTSLTDNGVTVTITAPTKPAKPDQPATATYTATVTAVDSAKNMLTVTANGTTYTVPLGKNFVTQHALPAVGDTISITGYAHTGGTTSMLRPTSVTISGSTITIDQPSGGERKIDRSSQQSSTATTTTPTSSSSAAELAAYVVSHNVKNLSQQSWWSANPNKAQAWSLIQANQKTIKQAITKKKAKK